MAKHDSESIQLPWQAETLALAASAPRDTRRPCDAQRQPL